MKHLLTLTLLLCSLTCSAMEMINRNAYGVRGTAYYPQPMPSTNNLFEHMTSSNNFVDTLYDYTVYGNNYTKGTTIPLTSTNTINSRSSLTMDFREATGYYWVGVTRPWRSLPKTLAFWVNPYGYINNGANAWQAQTMEGYANLSRSTQIDGTTHKLRIFYYTTSSQTFSSNATIPTNAWTHVAIVSGAWGTKIYLNGQLDSTNALTWWNKDGSVGTHWIGKGSQAYSANALVDDFRIYDEELSDTSILGLYQNSPSGN